MLWNGNEHGQGIVSWYHTVSWYRIRFATTNACHSQKNHLKNLRGSLKHVVYIRQSEDDFEHDFQLKRKVIKCTLKIVKVCRE